jgi:hypothetical protein
MASATPAALDCAHVGCWTPGSSSPAADGTPGHYSSNSESVECYYHGNVQLARQGACSKPCSTARDMPSAAGVEGAGH